MPLYTGLLRGGNTGNFNRKCLLGNRSSLKILCVGSSGVFSLTPGTKRSPTSESCSIPPEITHGGEKTTRRPRDHSYLNDFNETSVAHLLLLIEKIDELYLPLRSSGAVWTAKFPRIDESNLRFARSRAGVFRLRRNPDLDRRVPKLDARQPFIVSVYFLHSGADWDIITSDIHSRRFPGRLRLKFPSSKVITGLNSI